jgi:hypothetical protein
MTCAARTKKFLLFWPCRLPGLLLLGLCLGGQAQGAEPGDGSWWQPLSWARVCRPCPCPACPDDYCPKSAPPCPPRVCSHAPDDYCPKPLPCVTGVKCGGPDDYCPKPWRFCLPRCAPPWYTCGPVSTPAALCGR